MGTVGCKAHCVNIILVSIYLKDSKNKVFFSFINYSIKCKIIFTDARKGGLIFLKGTEAMFAHLHKNKSLYEYMHDAREHAHVHQANTAQQ